MASFHSSETAAEASLPATDYNFIHFTSDPRLEGLATSGHSHTRDEPSLCEEEMDTVNACAAGDIRRLKEVLYTLDKLGDKRATESNTLPLRQMLTVAIEHKQATVVESLLNAYPQLEMCDVNLLRAAFENPHLPTFKLLHSCSPDIINMEFHVSNSTALVESLVSPDPSIPNYMLDHGALVNEGGYHSLGALEAAVLRKQPLELIEKMVDLGAIIKKTALRFAVGRQDTRILKLLLDHGPYDQSALTCAHETRNEAVIALVEKRAKNLTKREKRQEANRIKSEQKDHGYIKWWQFWR